MRCRWMGRCDRGLVVLTTDRAVLIRYVRRDGQRRRGSGLRVGGRFVLTADHCAAGTGHVIVVGGAKYPAVVHVRSGSPGIDLAVLVAPKLPEVEPLGCAVLDREVPQVVRGCRALGFPVWKDGAGGPRLAQVGGDAPTAEGVDPQADPGVVPPMSLKITGPDIEVPRVLAGDLDQAGSRWAGMSGAVVVTADDQVVGVVRGHSPAEGVGSLTATRLEAIAGLPGHVAERFLAALGMPVPREWPRVPGRGRDARLSQAPAVPGWVDRGELAEVVSALTDPDSGPVALTTGLVGAGGFGKTMLAAKACQDREVMQRFGGGIMWVTVGRDAHGARLAECVRYFVRGAFPCPVPGVYP